MNDNSMILKRLKIITELSEELNKAKAALDEKLEDDPAYQKFQTEQLQIQEETKQKKDKIMTTQTIKAMDEELKNLRKEIKENKEILAVELAEYYKDNGSLEITDDEGNVKRIVFSAKLVNP
jgi:hypothetical protein